ncbi:MAG TPA: TlpA disulfide reductase family protein [Methylocystis sp.]|nr:TlpA disulfide reductase family protein [Methylocystis sp.]
MTEQPARPSLNRRMLAGAAALVVAVAAYLYTNSPPREPKAPNPACVAAAALASSLEPLAKGEVAAFAPAKASEPMETLAFNGSDGASTTLEAFKGKTILVNVWATWCVPCRQEMPALDRLQGAIGGDKFEVVAINVDTSRLDRPKALLAELGVKNLKFYADPKADIFFRLKQGGELLGLPTSYLLDPNGCALGQLSGPAAWDSVEAQALVRRAAGLER